MAGPVLPRLVVSSSGTDSDFVVKLIDVYPDEVAAQPAMGAYQLMIAADIFRGRIIDVTEKTYTIELTGNKAKLDAFIDSIERTSILETVRTGGSGIGRGERILKV